MRAPPKTKTRRWAERTGRRQTPRRWQPATGSQSRPDVQEGRPTTAPTRAAEAQARGQRAKYQPARPSAVLAPSHAIICRNLRNESAAGVAQGKGNDDVRRLDMGGPKTGRDQGRSRAENRSCSILFLILFHLLAVAICHDDIVLASHKFSRLALISVRSRRRS